LDNLTSVNYTLNIKSNDVLSDLSGLVSLTTVGGNLIVEDHYKLCEDDVDALLAQLTSFSGTVTISANYGTCPS
jgi:hypothetical protein